MKVYSFSNIRRLSPRHLYSIRSCIVLRYNTPNQYSIRNYNTALGSTIHIYIIIIFTERKSLDVVWRCINPNTVREYRLTGKIDLPPQL